MGKVKFQFANFKQAAAYSKWFVSQTFSSIACTTNWFGQISHLQSKLVLLCYYYHAQSVYCTTMCFMQFQHMNFFAP